MFAFLPADIITQILNFGLPAPIDLQIIGNNQVANDAYANELLKRIRKVPGIADLRIQQEFNYPQIRVDVDRSLASEVGLTERDVADSLLVTLAGSSQVAPTFWLNPKNGVSYPIVTQMPQYRIDNFSDLENLPVTGGGSSQILGALSHISRGPSDGVVSHLQCAAGHRSLWFGAANRSGLRGRRKSIASWTTPRRTFPRVPAWSCAGSPRP